MRIEPRAGTDPEVLALLSAQQEEIAQREIATLGSRVSNYPLREDIRYLGAVLDGRLIACGAIQRLDDEAAEIKRMYVLPEYRGRGVARRVLAALEELARSSGHTVLRLETGDFMPEAIKLYSSSGYTPIPTYGEYADNPNSRCFEKR